MKHYKYRIMLSVLCLLLFTVGVSSDGLTPNIATIRQLTIVVTAILAFSLLSVLAMKEVE